MANEQNLNPVRTEAEARELGRQGGIASGEARRRKRDLKALFEAIREERIEVKMPDGTRKATTFDEAAVIAMFQKAIRGDVRAMKLIATILGEYEQTVNIKGVAPIEVKSEKDAEEMRAMLDNIKERKGE